MKYIIFKNSCGLEYPILFPNFIQHQIINAQINDEPISAGFCKIGIDGKHYTYGESFSLSISSRLIDDTILNRED